MAKIKTNKKDPFDRAKESIGAGYKVLSLSENTKEKAMLIIDEIKDIPCFSMRKPSCVAAGAVYIAALINGEKRSQERIGIIFGITAVALRENYKKILDETKLEKCV